MDGDRGNLLIVEDDVDIADMLNAYFRDQGYSVSTVNWGEDALHTCQSALPDLVILDIRLPDMDGFEVARHLRASRKTKDLPIIFLTERRERKDRLVGLQLNADDYITKPFDMYELRLRVRNALERARRSSLTHPVTSLPVGALVDEHLRQFLDKNDRAIFINSLRNTERFREVYGFVASDDVLRAVSLMMQDVLKEFGTAEDFLGQLNDNTFIVIASPEAVAAIQENLSKRLKQSFDYFYRDQDRNAEIFRDQRLSASFCELQPGQSYAREIQQFKAELEKLCRSGKS